MTCDVATGLDRVAAGEVRIPGQRAALLTNSAARTAAGASAVDVMAAACRLTLLLGPEHGIEGTASAGEEIAHSRIGNLPALSLYGAEWGPVEAALRHVDTVVIDLQDAGCRYYTYPWTVTEVMRAGERLGFTVLLLDRPNPLGRTIEGGLPDVVGAPVCAARVPVRHGLTLGELAFLQKRDLRIDVGLQVVRVIGWASDSLWPQTGLPWVPPSPNLRTFEAALLYPGTCLLEGTNVCEGRGTESPFQIVGAPFVDADRLAARLRAEPALGGATVTPISFIPGESKWQGRVCHGVHIAPATDTRPVAVGVALVSALQAYPDFTFEPSHFDALAGGLGLRTALQSGHAAAEIACDWAGDEAAFDASLEDMRLYRDGHSGEQE